jgi:aerobic-type carbon monoxide dehydrogenase small subunit (CoxS/CutS family)
VTVELTVSVNGEQHSAVVDGRKTLADFLRQELGLTGTHLGCEHGVCGSCTVLVDGASARSCLMLAAQANGTEITTIEGLEVDGELNDLQRALRDSHGFQCGFCTPGFMMTATELLRENPQPSEAQVREAISGNICRCTGYQSIVKGIMDAAELIHE